MELEDCLPAALRGGSVTKIAAGLSGAGVYRGDLGSAAGRWEFGLALFAECRAQ